MADRVHAEDLAGGDFHGVADDRDLDLAVGVSFADLVVEPGEGDPATGVDLASHPLADRGLGPPRKFDD